MYSINEKIVCSNMPKRGYCSIEAVMGVILPVINEIYTIRDISIIDGTLAFHLQEIVNPVINYLDGTDEIWFAAKNFRKLDYQFAEDVISMIKEQELVNV